MIIDVTGIELTPGNSGMNCKGNGICFDENGELIECCCDECDYMQCCLGNLSFSECKNCNDLFCPRVQRKNE